MAKTPEVYRAIRDEIIGGVILSDEIILEQAVALRFGVSKVTAREALQRLCNEKYLKSFPRKGYLVTDISALQLRQIQQVRFQIESLAIRLVIRDCPDEEIASLRNILKGSFEGSDPHKAISTRFHLQIAQMSGNEYIYDSLYTYLGYTSRYALTAGFADRFSDYKSCHEDIVKAMLRRDAPAALEALRLDLMLKDEDT